jgi:hypothetical protein
MNFTLQPTPNLTKTFNVNNVPNVSKETAKSFAYNNAIKPAVSSQPIIKRHVPYVLIRPDLYKHTDASKQTLEQTYNDVDQTRLSTMLRIPSGEIYRNVLTKIGKDTTFDEKFKFVHWAESNKSAFILDPRYDALMKGVIRNFMYYMNPQGWNLTIMSYSGHKAQIEKDFPTCRFIPIDESIISKNHKGEYSIRVEDYNSIFRSASFWRTLPEKIAVFQKDCVMYRMFSDHFAEYYDYAGANFYNTPSPIYGGMNGGFSLRKRDVMLECIEKVIMRDPRHPTVEIDINEDVFFTHACEQLRKLVPDKIHRTFLAIEIDMNTETSAYHGWHHNYHSSEFAIYMLSRSEFLLEYL